MGTLRCGLAWPCVAVCWGVDHGHTQAWPGVAVCLCAGHLLFRVNMLVLKFYLPCGGHDVITQHII